MYLVTFRTGSFTPRAVTLGFDVMTVSLRGPLVWLSLTVC